MYFALDFLIQSGKSLITLPLAKRRAALGELFKALRRASSPLQLSETMSAAAEAMIRVSGELGFEGVMAKRLTSVYEPGRRSGAWVKYRINKGQEFVVGGYTPGNPFDAIIVGYYDGKNLLYAGKVRAGFVPHTRREVLTQMRQRETNSCPFANLPEKKRTQWALTREEMKNCVWLKPGLVAQIEFTEWTPDGHLRHASFSGLRTDKSLHEIVREAD